MYHKLIFEVSKEGRIGYSPTKKPIQFDLDSSFLRQDDLLFPEVSELDVVRHYTNLSRKNYGVDQGFYPLGSCTMKYNPKINDELANLPLFTRLHPLQPDVSIQGVLELYHKMGGILSDLTGLGEFTFHGFAGAHGELIGLMIMKEYHTSRGDYRRKKVIVPVTAHGTNPATCTVCGFEVIEVGLNEEGLVDIEALKSLLNDEIAGIMLTNPNTLGLYEKDILEISRLVHDAGGLLYYDGANLNALLGLVKPGEMGFDILHLNLHKTFSTPHGGGGPGSGPVGVRKDLAQFLPNPQIRKGTNKLEWFDHPNSIGRVGGFAGNFLVVLRAYSYLLTLGKENISKVGRLAVLNANYVKEKLKEDFTLPIASSCMHEVVFDGLRSGKATTLEVAKRLLDYGYHPPTIYFPLLFHQSLMIEPTEVESKETLDEFIDIMKKIAAEALTSPEILREAPHNTPVRRLDEATAARNPIVKYRDLLHE